MITKEVPTFTGVIWVGTKNRDTNSITPTETLLAAIQEYVNNIGLCVSVTPTTFIYTNGIEPGLAIGLINYPRFPQENEVIQQHAINLAEILKIVAHQYKVSIVFPTTTVMLSTEVN